MIGRMFCVGVVLPGLVLMLLLLPGSHGQTVTLGAGATGQNAPFSVYFADGQNTSVIGRTYLPECLVGGGSGPYIWLEKTDDSLRIAEHGQVNGLAGLPWDTTAHPTLNTSYTGTYVCRTSTRNSTELYQIFVVQRILTQQPSSLLVNDTGEKYTIKANVSGVLPVTVSWTSSATLATQELNQTSFSFRSNDSGIQVGVPFTITLSARYTADIPCAGSTTGNGYKLAQAVIDNCNAAAMPSQATTTVTVQATPCDKLHSLGLHVNATTSTPNRRGAKVTLVCTGNHNLTNAIREVECLAPGKWTTLPVCEVTHCPAQKQSTIKRVDRRPVNSDVNVPVSCIDGYDNPTRALYIRCLPGGVWSTPQPVCSPICLPLPVSNFTIKSIARHPVNPNVNVSVLCVEGYGEPMPPVIQCLAIRKWSAQPYCSPVDECMTGMHNCSQNCTDTTPGFNCTCYDGRIGCFAAPTPPPSSTLKTNSGLNSGAIAGITIGAVLIVVIICLVVYFVLKRDSRAEHTDEARMTSQDHAAVKATEFSKFDASG